MNRLKILLHINELQGLETPSDLNTRSLLGLILCKNCELEAHLVMVLECPVLLQKYVAWWFFPHAQKVSVSELDLIVSFSTTTVIGFVGMVHCFIMQMVVVSSTETSLQGIHQPVVTGVREFLIAVMACPLS